MKLTGRQRTILRTGILRAYPEDQLKIILLEKMDLNLGEFNRGEDYNTKVFNLIIQLEANGKLKDFIRIIVEENSNSPFLDEVESEFKTRTNSGVDSLPVAPATDTGNPAIEPIARIHDLKSAPEVLNPFYGRIKELNTLETWILEDISRLITIYGITGIGKTCFVRHLVERIKNRFQGVIWRSLKTPPPAQPPTLTKFLQDILKSLNPQFARELSLTLDSNVRTLLDQLINDLDRHRCLLILDDFEFILQDEATAGTYKEGYDGYGYLLEEIAKKSHKSCLLINSWEQPQGLTSWSEYPCKSHELLGLGDAAEDLLKSEGLKEPENYQKLIYIYRGNPLALKLMATSIKEVFQGSIAKYLAQNTLVNPSEYCDKFAKMLKRLSFIEKDILRALSSQNQELNFDTLGEKVNELAQEDGRSSYRRSSFLLALESLKNRSLIESIKGNDNLTYRTVQPLVRRYFQT